MIGMPPATAASNSRSLPAASAAAYSSAPTLARSSLFAVTTGLPAASASRIRLRAGSMPPIASTTRSTSGSATTPWASRVRIVSSTSTSRWAERLRTATRVISSRMPGSHLDGVLLRPDEFDERTADVATAEQPDPDHVVRHGTQARGRRRLAFVPSRGSAPRARPVASGGGAAEGLTPGEAAPRCSSVRE